LCRLHVGVSTRPSHLRRIQEESGTHTSTPVVDVCPGARCSTITEHHALVVVIRTLLKSLSNSSDLSIVCVCVCVCPSDVRRHLRQHSKSTRKSSRRKISRAHRRRSLHFRYDWIPRCGLSQMVPSARREGPQANKEGQMHLVNIGRAPTYVINSVTAVRDVVSCSRLRSSSSHRYE